MDSFLLYIIKAFIASGIMTCYYWFFLRNTKLHTFNRYYLLLTLIVSLVIPFVSIELPVNTALYNNTVLNNLFAANQSADANPSSTGISVSGLLLGLALLVSATLLITLLLKVLWIYRIIRSHTTVKMSGYNFIETQLPQAPFTFLNNLFWKKGLPAGKNETEKILQHELTHIKQKHTYDKLCSQLIACAFWMNPFYWIIKKELTVIHEFIADSNTIEDGDVAGFAHLLLQSHNEGRYLDPSNSFFQSPIKRRIAMLTKLENSSYSFLRRSMVLPVIVCTLLGIACSKQKDKQEQLPAEQPVAAQQSANSTQQTELANEATDDQHITPELLNKDLPGKIIVNGKEVKQIKFQFKEGGEEKVAIFTPK